MRVADSEPVFESDRLVSGPRATDRAARLLPRDDAATGGFWKVPLNLRLSAEILTLLVRETFWLAAQWVHLDVPLTNMPPAP